jgi:flagellar hook-associated protein 3 FlgL
MAVSTLGQTNDNIFRLNELQRQLGELQTQLASGKKTQRFKGLETDVIRSQRSRADLRSIETYKQNILNAERRIKQTLNTIEEFQAQASNFAASLDIFMQEGVHQEGDIIYYDDPLTPGDDRIAVGMDSAEPSVDLQSLQDMAENLFNLMTDLVNEKDGDRYVLSGAQSLSKPLGNTGLLTTANSALINDWKNGALGTNNLIEALQTRDTSVNSRAITDSVVGYSAELSTGNTKSIFVRVDDTAEIDYTVLATEDGFRDVLVAMDFVRNTALLPVVDEVDPDNPLNVVTSGAPGNDISEMQQNFFAVFGSINQMVTRALDDLDVQRFKLEQVRANLGQVREDHILVENTLIESISNIEDADMNEIALQTNFLQTRLEASYRVTATISQLTLVNFL